MLKKPLQMLHYFRRLVILMIAVGVCPFAKADDSTGTEVSTVPAYVSTHHSAYVSATTAAPSTDFSTLPACNAPMSCPEEADKFVVPTGSGYSNSIFNSNCPDVCTVTRNPEAITQFLSGSLTQNSVCPQGYAQIASFDVQNEAIFQQGQTSARIQNMTQYNQLNTNKAITGVTITNNNFTNQFNNPTLGNFTCDNPAVGRTFDNSDTMMNSWFSSVGGVPAGYVYTITGINTDDRGCSGAGWCLDCGWAGTNTRVTNITVTDVLYSVASGYTPTGKTIPVAVVCARITQQWLSAP